MTKAHDARTRRKAMLRGRLEPVPSTTVRTPWDGSTAKTGRVLFRDESDQPRLSVVVTIDDDGTVVVETRGTGTVRVTHVHGAPDGTP